MVYVAWLLDLCIPLPVTGANVKDERAISLNKKYTRMKYSPKQCLVVLLFPFMHFPYNKGLIDRRPRIPDQNTMIFIFILAGSFAARVSGPRRNRFPVS